MEARIERRIDTADELVLDIEVKKQFVGELIEQAYMAVSTQREVFPQEGESLQAACERVLGQHEAGQLASNAVMNMAYPFARSQAEDATTVGSPLFTRCGSLEEGEPFHFTARWAKLPQAELTSYDPVEIEVPSASATDEMIDEQLAGMLDAQARFEKTDERRPVEAGDVVSLSLHVTLEGDEVEGLCFDERVYTTGVGAMPDGFEEAIVGMSPGEGKEFDFEGIADFDKDEQPVMGTYHAQATLKALMQKVVPELTDEWVAANVTGSKTVAELRAAIKEQLDGQLAGERRHYVNYVAASELAKRFEGSIPDVAYEAMRDEIQMQFDHEAAAMGLTREQYMRQQGADEQQFSVRMVLQVRERLAQSIALDALARHLGLEVEEADLVEFYKASAPAGQALELRKQLEQSGRSYMAVEGARRLKANDYLVSHAIVHEQ